MASTLRCNSGICCQFCFISRPAARLNGSQAYPRRSRYRLCYDNGRLSNAPTISFAFPPLISSRAGSAKTWEPQGMLAFANTPKPFSAEALTSMRHASDNILVYTAANGAPTYHDPYPLSSRFSWWPWQRRNRTLAVKFIYSVSFKLSYYMSNPSVQLF